MKNLDGAWEPKGYIGPRVEISGNKLVRLWMNSPVLETKFSVVEKDGKTLLQLDNNELRYSGSASAYATVEECRVEGDAIVFTDFFPITGKSTEELYRTEKSRYGDVTIVENEYLRLLRGRWESDSAVLVFSGNKVKYGFGDDPDREETITVVKRNYDGAILIRCKDPAKKAIGPFENVTLFGEMIRAIIPIMDAPAPSTFTFIKKKKKGLFER